MTTPIPIRPDTPAARCAAEYFDSADSGLADARRLLAIARDLEPGVDDFGEPDVNAIGEFVDRIRVLLEAAQTKLENIGPEIEGLHALARSGQLPD